ncbi:MAG: DUF4240 domain-containing protein [Saprospiraceae bacterium]
MATVLKVKINDINSQFFHDLGEKISDTAEIEIRIPQKNDQTELFSDAQFWQVIEAFDWSKSDSDEIMAPATAQLSAMPVMNIYLFADKLSEKLYQLDTQLHGDAYLAHEGDDYLSVDDFLYIRCAVVAEGKAYFEKVLNDPTEFPADITFEPLLSLADDAYEKKTGRKFDYHPTFNYETYSNKEGWK